MFSKFFQSYLKKTIGGMGLCNMSAEDASLLQLQIEQLKLELNKLEPYVQKINDLIKVTTLKKSALEDNIKELKKPKLIVSLEQYGKIKKEIHSLSVIINNYQVEVDRIKEVTPVQHKKIKEMEAKKNEILGNPKMAVVLDFKKRCKN